MMNETKLNDLLRKIRALKAKADSPATTEAESLAFATKVAELLAAHGLEEAQLKIEDQEQVGHEDYIGNWNTSPARRLLVMAICKLYMVRPLIRTEKGRPWTLIGRKHNIFMVKEMSAYLIKTTIRLSNEYGRITMGANIIDFRRGCFKRLAERLIDLHIQQTRAPVQYTPQGNPENLPALYANESQLTQDYMRSRWSTVPLKSKRIKQGADAAAGRAAGDNISLNQQVTGGRSNHLLERK